MVVHRVVHHLKSRPQHERERAAFAIAAAVVAVLLLAWISYVLHGVFANPASPEDGSASASDSFSSSAVRSAGQQLQQTYRDATLQIQGRPQDIATSSAPDPDVQELNITQIRQ